MRLGEKFFNRNTITVAQELIGKYLVRRRGNRTIAAMITETEAYHGPYDRASHASRGLTPRTRVMFGSPGRTYVYLVYGMYHCLNFVTCRRGFPAAVLIRAVRNKRLKIKSDGPGKVCRVLNITRALNNLQTNNKKLWIEDRGIRIRPRHIIGSPRIGVGYASTWALKPWRFRLLSELSQER